MPRVRADGATPDWPQLQARAAAQDGYFSLREAAAHGIGRQLLQHHGGTGRLRRIGRGAFQLAHFAPAVHEGCVAAWLWSGGAGRLSHETALKLHGLIDEWPAQVHLTVPHSWRRARLGAPEGVVLHYWDVPNAARVGRVPLPYSDLDSALYEAAAASSEPALVEAAFVRVLERGLRNHMDMVVLLHLYHPLRAKLRIQVPGLAGAAGQDS